MSVLDLETVRDEAVRDEAVRDKAVRDKTALDKTALDNKDAPVRPRPSRSPGRPARGRGRATTPRSRPAAPVPAPTLAPVAAPLQRRACASTPPNAARPARAAQAPVPLRLTDRGIAVVLVAVAMVVVAALAVVLPTALRVTGDNYQPIGTSQLAKP